MPLRRILPAVLAAAVTALAAAPAQATIDFRSCIRDNETTGVTCASSAPSLSRLSGIELGPDGNQLYTAAFNDGALQVWNRGAAGDPSFVRCFQDSTRASVTGAECGSPTYPAMDYLDSIAISPDGRQLYVNGQGITTFNRDPATGELTYSGCIGPPEGPGSPSCATRTPMLAYGAADIALSRDGETLYAVGGTADRSLLSVFDRNTSTGALTPSTCFKQPGTSDACAAEAAGFDGTVGVAVAPDGLSVYVSSMDASAITEFRRDPGPGHALAVAGCIYDPAPVFGGPPSAPGCDPVEGLARADRLAVAADGRTVTVAGDQSVIGVLARDPSTSRLTFAGCIRQTGSGSPTTRCAESPNVASAGEMYITPDGRNLYAGGHNFDGLVNYARDPSTGFLTFVECIRDVAPLVFAPACAKTANGLLAAHEMTTSPDGRVLYVTAGYLDGPGALLVFDRTADTAPATAAPAVTASELSVPASASSVSLPLSCPTGVFEFCQGELSATESGGVTKSAKATRVSVRAKTKKGRAKVRVALSKSGRATLKRTGRVRVKVSFRRVNATGSSTKAKTRTVVVKAKR